MFVFILIDDTFPIELLNVRSNILIVALLKGLRATRSLGFGERDVLSSTNVTKVDNVSIKHNTQIFGALFEVVPFVKSLRVKF